MAAALQDTHRLVTPRAQLQPPQACPPTPSSPPSPLTLLPNPAPPPQPHSGGVGDTSSPAGSSPPSAPGRNIRVPGNGVPCAGGGGADAAGWGGGPEAAPHRARERGGKAGAGNCGRYHGEVCGGAVRSCFRVRGRQERAQCACAGSSGSLSLPRRRTAPLPFRALPLRSAPSERCAGRGGTSCYPGPGRGGSWSDACSLQFRCSGMEAGVIAC